MSKSARHPTASRNRSSFLCRTDGFSCARRRRGFFAMLTVFLVLLSQILTVSTGAAWHVGRVAADDAAFFDDAVICHGGTVGNTVPSDRDVPASGGMGGCDLCPVCQSGDAPPLLTPSPPVVPAPHPWSIGECRFVRRESVPQPPTYQVQQPRAPPSVPHTVI